MNPRRRTPIILGVTAAVALAACGSGSTSTKVGAGAAGPQPPSTSTTRPVSAPAPDVSTTVSTAPARSSLPSVEILDTANGQTVQFSSLVPAVKPVLFWFWAPH